MCGLLFFFDFKLQIELTVFGDIYKWDYRNILTDIYTIIILYARVVT